MKKRGVQKLHKYEKYIQRKERSTKITQKQSSEVQYLHHHPVLLNYFQLPEAASQFLSGPGDLQPAGQSSLNFSDPPSKSIFKLISEKKKYSICIEFVEQCTKFVHSKYS